MRETSIEFRCTEEEKEEIKERARQANLSMSKYIISTLNQQIGSIASKIIVLELMDIIKEIEYEKKDIDLVHIKERIKGLWQI